MRIRFSITRRGGQTWSEIVALAVVVLAMSPFILILAGKIRSTPRLSFIGAPQSVVIRTNVKFACQLEKISKWFGVRACRGCPVVFQIAPATSGRITGYWDRFGELVEVDQLSVEVMTDADGLATVRVAADDPGSFRLTASLPRSEAEEVWDFTAE